MRRILVFLLSILTICVGYIMLTNPLETLEITSVVLGIIILIPSIILFIFTFHSIILNRFPLYMISISGIILGILLMGNEVFGVKILTILFGLHMILTSLIQMFYLKYKYFFRPISKFLSFIINGINILLGLLILFDPIFAEAFTGTYIAISVMFQGILMSIVALEYDEDKKK